MPLCAPSVSECVDLMAAETEGRGRLPVRVRAERRITIREAAANVDGEMA